MISTAESLRISLKMTDRTKKSILTTITATFSRRNWEKESTYTAMAPIPPELLKEFRPVECLLKERQTKRAETQVKLSRKGLPKSQKKVFATLSSATERLICRLPLTLRTEE